MLIDRINWLRSQWWHFAKRYKKGVTCKVGRDARLKLYFDSKLASLIYYRSFELSERLFVKRLLKKNDVFFDVGANIGLYTVIASPLVGLEGRVHSFEPNPRTFARLLENIDLNRCGNVEANNKALSGKEDVLEIETSDDWLDAWSSLRPRRDSMASQSSMVECMTLDAYFDLHQVKGPVLLKIDVEGWEEYVISGARKTLASAHVIGIIMEISSQVIVDILHGHGFILFSFRRDQPLVIDRFRSPQCWDTTPNVIATREPMELKARIPGLRIVV